MSRIKIYLLITFVFLISILAKVDLVSAIERLTGCPNITDRGVTIFEHAYCDGNALNFESEGTYNLEISSISHYASSVYVQWGWSAKISNGSQSTCHNWAAWNFALDTWPNGDQMNDTATNVVVYDSPNCNESTDPTPAPVPSSLPSGCPAINDNGITLFKNAYCSGENKNFSEAGVYYLPNFVFSEVTSSAYVQNGWSVKFYADNVDYCKNWSAWDFGIDSWSDGSSMNDRIKAVQVYDKPDCGLIPQPTEEPQNELDEVKLLNIFFVPDSVTPAYNPKDLINQVIQAMKETSHNEVNYKVVDEETVNRSTTKKSDGRMDYNALLSEFDICSRLTADEIDEVWVWVNGADGAGWEWIVSGSMNYPENINSCGQDLVIMGFDYTRTYDLALHSFGHRMEYLASRTVGFEYYDWEQECGNVHFPPNGVQDYDYANQSSVQTSCNGQLETISCSTWNCTQEGYMKWWFEKIPSEWWREF